MRGREDVLVFLRHTDRHHAGTAGSGLCGQVATHNVDLAVTLVEADHRDVVGLREQRDRVAERCAHLLHDRRRGNRIAQVLGHEPHHLPGDLKVRHVAVEIDPVQALQIQGHVTIQKIVHRQRFSHHPRMTQARHAKPARSSAVRGRASLEYGNVPRKLRVLAPDLCPGMTPSIPGVRLPRLTPPRRDQFSV